MDHSTQHPNNTPLADGAAQRDRQILDALPAGALLTRVSDGTILFANRAIGKLLGIEDVSTVIGTPVPNFYWHPDDRQIVLGRFRAEGSLTDYELRTRRMDGSMFWVSISIQWFDFMGEKVLLSTILDITDKKAAEQQVVENEKRLHALFGALPLPVIVTQISDGKVLYANPQTSQLIGLPLEQIIGNQTPDFYHNPTDRLRFVQTLQKEGRVRNAEIQIKKQNGTLLWVEITIEMISYGGVPATIAVIEDISERKRMEEIEREAERKYRQLYLSIRDGVASIDLTGNILECNAAFEEMVGYTLEELQQFKFTDLTPAKWHAMELQILEEQVMTRGYSRLYQKEYIHKDGHIFPIELAVYLTRDAEGNPSGFWGFIRDITERKQAEAELSRLQSAVEQAGDGIAIADLNGGLLYANPAWAQMHGYAGEDLREKHLSMFHTPEQIQQDVIPFNEKVMAVGSNSGEVGHVRKDGTTFPTLMSTTLLKDENATPIGLIGTVRDISAQRQAQEALRVNEERLELALGAANIANWEFEPLAGKVYFSPRWYKMLGYEPDELPQSYETWAGLLHPEDRTWAEPLVGQAIQTGGDFDINFRMKTRDGDWRWINAIGRTTDRNESGVTTRMVGTHLDITERQRAERSLRESQAIINESQRQLSTLFANLPGMAYRMVNEPSWPATFISPGAYLLTGYRPEEFMRGEHHRIDFGDLIVEEDRQPVWEQVQKGLEARQPYEMTYRIQTAQQEIRWVWERGQGVFDEAGNLRSLEGFISDITERVRLEDQVHTALERRGRQVQLSTQVAQDIAAATDLYSLYERVVTQVKERFGYYHVQLLRFDPALNAVALVIGYGEIGAKMLAAGHKLPMGIGLIGTATASGKTVLRPDLAAGDPDWKPNPLLPETKGEIAVPILWQDKVLGVLDVQSAEVGALGADDQLLLEGLCGQIAIAVEQTRLREEMQERLAEINALYRSMSREGWKTFTQAGVLPEGFLFEQGAVRPMADLPAPVEQAFVTTPLTVPGGVTIGSLAIESEVERPLSPEDESFLQQISEQVALALESARLFAQTQLTLAETEDLYQASAELNTAKTYNDVLEAMRLNTLLGKNSQNISLNLFDRPWTPQEKPEWIDVLARWSILPAGAVMDRYPLSAFPSAQTLLRPDAPTLVEDVENDPALDENARALYARRFGAKSTAFVPLVVSEQWIGYMNAIYQQQTPFLENEVRRLMALAAQAAVVVNNQRLLDETRARVRREQILRQVTTQVRASVDADTILRTAVRELGGALGRETFIQLGGPAGQVPPSTPDSPQPVDAEEQGLNNSPQ